VDSWARYKEKQNGPGSIRTSVSRRVIYFTTTASSAGADLPPPDLPAVPATLVDLKSPGRNEIESTSYLVPPATGGRLPLLSASS